MKTLNIIFFFFFKNEKINEIENIFFDFALQKLLIVKYSKNIKSPFESNVNKIDYHYLFLKYILFTEMERMQTNAMIG